MFTNLVATLKADLDAFKGDLGEFVTTVKTDTTAILGLQGGVATGANVGASVNALGSAASQLVQWDEELYDNPELLCADPEDEDDYNKTGAVSDEEIEGLLSGSISDLVPELYKELVPARATHADFFRRLVFHRERFAQAMKNRVALDRPDEEETGWEDDEDVVIPAASPPVQQQTLTAVLLNKDDDEDLRAKLTETTRALETSRKEFGQANEELSRTLQELETTRSELNALKASAVSTSEDTVDIVTQLRQELANVQAASRAEIARLTAELAHAKDATAELESMKKILSDAQEKIKSLETQVSELPHAKKASDSKTVEETMVSAPTSWEALPTSPTSSSNEEPVVLTKPGSGAEEEDVDDWED